LSIGGTKSGRPAPTRVAVFHPSLKSRGASARSPEARLDEAIGLARAIDLDVVAADVVPVARPRPATYLGSGAVDELAGLITGEDIELVCVDTALTPVQQRNLERAWKCKVIDRTGLILEIFGERARTREGRLQVELAHLTYQRSRLVRSWTHLERQRGGLGAVGGPGETQIESDRRQIDERIVRIKRALDKVVRTRELHRSARKRIPNPVIALVGYTNAGKSTLFNRLTESRVFADNLLFATLDPTMRGIEMPSGRTVILSDTVGFVSDLPTDLIAAFRATLEEVVEADIIVHVRDISHLDSAAQAKDVEAVLGDLGIGENGSHPVIEALNKIDLLDEEERAIRLNQIERRNDAVAISAKTGEGCAALLEILDDSLNSARRIVVLDVDVADGAAIAWLYRHGQVLSRRDDEEKAHMEVSLDAADLARFERRTDA
jgi:GTP-binding protein HflX